MAGSALKRHSAQLMARLYPAFSRRATQVCILSAALEKIEAGNCIDPRTVAREALEQADPFGWTERRKTPNAKLTGPSEHKGNTDEHH